MQSNIVQVLEYCIFYIFIFSTDIDECSSASGNECDSNTNCTNTEGSYNCMCFNGYSGNGTTCTGKKNLYSNHNKSRRFNIISVKIAI